MRSDCSGVLISFVVTDCMFNVPCVRRITSKRGEQDETGFPANVSCKPKPCWLICVSLLTTFKSVNLFSCQFNLFCLLSGLLGFVIEMML